jgi:hypothetical protein
MLSPSRSTLLTFTVGTKVGAPASPAVSCATTTVAAHINIAIVSHFLIAAAKVRNNYQLLIVNYQLFYIFAL